MDITFTIPDQHVSLLITAINTNHPRPTDEETGESDFTEAQWAKEYFRRLMVREVYVYQRNQAQQQLSLNDGLVS